MAEASFAVVYKGQPVGRYFADILVDEVLVVELKCAERSADEHTAQCLNYLRASGRTVCLLINFQKPKIEWKRIVLGFTDPPKARGTQEVWTTGRPSRSGSPACRRDLWTGAISRYLPCSSSR